MSSVTGTNTNATASSALGASLGTGKLDQQAFLNLLITQLRNQDPIEPQSNTEFLAQLAQFSQLQQTQTLTETIQAQTLMQQLTFGASLAGHTVKYVDDSGAEQTGVVSSVRVESSGLLLQVNGRDVPLGSVFEILAPADSSSGGSTT
jgi:flagellar basal-body rod modification protein FlgD